jgi:hypothetical protein
MTGRLAGRINTRGCTEAPLAAGSPWPDKPDNLCRRCRSPRPAAYVEQVTQALQARGALLLRRWQGDRPAGKYLAEELSAIYGEQAAAVVVFVSAAQRAGPAARL